MPIRRGYTPKHKVHTDNRQMIVKCASCGQFLSVCEMNSNFTPDSELTVEKTSHYCNVCWRKDDDDSE